MNAGVGEVAPRGQRGREVLRGVWRGMTREETSVAAGGIAFYAFLAFLPGVLSVVLAYGVVADPEEVQRQVAFFARILPPQALEFLMGEMPRMAAQSDQAFGSGAITGLLIAVWSASKGIQGAMRAVGPSSAAAISLNRLRRVGVAVVLAGGGLVVIVAAVAVVAAFPALLERLGLSHVRALTIGIFRWPAFAAIVFAWLSALYKYAPDKHPPWREVAPGALAATFVWLAGSIAFSTYVTRFGGQAVIYGSLAAAAALLIWFLLAAYALLLGSELNAALTPEAQSTIAAPAR